MYRSEPQFGARVRVYNESMMATLLDPEPDESYAPSPEREGAPSPSRTTDRDEELATLASMRRERTNQKKKELQDLEEQRKRRYDRNRTEARGKAVENQRRVKEAIMVSELKRETGFQNHFGSITAGRRLEAEIKARQDLEDEAERNKKVRQYEEWNLNVYGKIQDRVGSKLDNMTYDELNHRKNAEFQKFLDTTNSKGAIFRDIIIESEYDPLEPNRRCIKVPTKDLRDPCRRVLDKALDERVDLSRHELDQMRQAKQREILDIEEWATGKIEATPHGFFAKMMNAKNATANTAGSVTTNSTFKSNIPFDHYNVSTAKEVTDAEFPKGKRTRPQV